MIKIFVSSTFRDMQAERDEIQKNIAPRLRAAAREYGEDVEFCDLRWGVDTSLLGDEESSKKVMSVCLDEIDKCRPYMLVLLGERYGWMPDSRLLLDTAARKNFTPSCPDASVTALEIEYGALSSPEALKKTVFMFRDPIQGARDVYKSEDSEHARRLCELKEKIRSLAGERVFSYQVGWDSEAGAPCGLEQFSETVTEQFLAILDEDFEAYRSLSETGKERRRHWSYIESKSSQFAGRQELFELCREKLEGRSRALLVTGGAGNGKSTLCARLITDYRARGWYVFPFVCGNGGDEKTGLDALMYLALSLEEGLDEEERRQYEQIAHSAAPDSEEAGWSFWNIRLDILLKKFYSPAGKKVLFAVIGAERFENDESTEKFKYIPELKNQVLHVLVCCDDTYKTESFPGQKVTVPELSDGEKGSVIRGIMSSSGKELDGSVIDEIMRKKRSSVPLYLSLLTRCLLTFDFEDFGAINEGGGGMDAISGYMRNFVAGLPEDEVGLSRVIFRRLARSDGTELITAAIEYIAASRFGLREQDIRALLGGRGISWNRLDFSRLIDYSAHFFIENNGLFDFSDAAFKAAVRSNSDLREMTSELFLYIKSLPDTDALKISEIVYCCHATDDKDLLMRFLISVTDRDDRDAARKAAHSILNTDVCVWFMLAIRDITDPQLLLHIYNFWCLYVMDGVGSKRRDELSAARVICEALAVKAMEFASSTGEEIFRCMLCLLTQKEGELFMKLRNFGDAAGAFNSACVRAAELYKDTGGKEYKYIFANSAFRAGKAYSELSGSGDAEDMFDVAEDTFESLVRETSETDAALGYCEAKYEHALVCWQQGHVLESEGLCLDAISIYRQLYAMKFAGLLEDIRQMSSYKNACEMLSYIFDLKKGSPGAPTGEEAAALDSEIRRLERMIEDLLWDPMLIREYARSLKKFGELCESVGYRIGALHDYVLCVNMLRWAAENGGGSVCIKDYYAGCYELAGFYKKIGQNDYAVRYYLEDIRYRRQVLSEYPFFGNALMFSDRCAALGQLFVEIGSLWAAYEAFREAAVCFGSVDDAPEELAASLSEQRYALMYETASLIEPWRYTGAELEENQRRAKKLLGWDEVLHW